MPILEYNRAAATAYAREWALKRNPAYYDFQLLGGDCTNFASQCLYAGAGVMNYTPDTGWYYIDLARRAPAWTGVRFLYAFLTGNRGPGPFASVVTEDHARPGDLIQLAWNTHHWYHTLVILSVKPEIRVAAHTYDALDKPLREYGYSHARFLHIEGVRI